jgi:5-bromo-4-chloroindolyl phosphate hydrolysis protein
MNRFTTISYSGGMKMEGKLIKFSSKEERMWTAKLDDRDMEILKDVLEAHHENLKDILKDCVVDEDTRFQYMDELVRIERILGLIYMEVEDETN